MKIITKDNKNRVRKFIQNNNLEGFYDWIIEPVWERYVELTADCVFVHVPKTAGSSIATAINMKGITHSSAKQWKQHIGKKSFYKRFKFAVVRHPIDRVVSGALWGYALKYSSTNEKSGFSRDYDKEAVLTNINVSDFVNTSLKESLNNKEWLETRQMNKMLDSGKGIELDFIGKFEDMNGVIETLRSEKLLVNDLPNLKKISKNTKESVVIEKEVFDSLVTYFEKDFSMFNYDPYEVKYEISNF